MTDPNAAPTTPASEETISDALHATSSSYLDDLVGEGKKYKTPEDLAKSYIHADKHINELEEERKEQREQSRILTELLEEVRKGRQIDDDEEETVVATPTSGDRSLSDEEIEQKVAKVLEKQKTSETAKQNSRQSFNNLVEHVGSAEGAKIAMRKFAAENPHLENSTAALANTDPNAFLKFIQAYIPAGAEYVNSPGVIEQSSANAVAASVGGELTWSKVREIRKKDPELYRSEEFTLKMEQAIAKAASRGDDFFAT